jgi:GNAT superfamily N-acetyltransferase
MNSFEEIWEIYVEAFPIDERRSRESQWRLFNTAQYKIIPYKKERCLIGFMGIWEFSSFTFVEHFAIKKEFRGSGYGTEMLKELLKDCDHRIILEVEPPEGEIAQKRIGFYQRHGFFLNPYEYIQPPYEDGQNPLPLLLMSFPEPLTRKAFDEAEEMIYRFVYEISADKK